MADYSASALPSPFGQAQNANLPSFVRPELVAATDDLTLVHDLLAGTRRMQTQAKAKGYIRKWTEEDDAIYRIRSQCETVFEGLGRTLSAAVGMLFAKPPQLTWNASEAAFEDAWPNLDGAGTAGPVFVKRFSEQAIRDGLAVIFVDPPVPPTDENGQRLEITSENEARFNLRPMWVRYTRSQVINWRFATIANQLTPTLLVFAETADVDDGTYGLRTVRRFRVLRLVLTPDGYQATWELLELRGDPRRAASYVLIGGGVFKNKTGQVRDTLPVAIGYTGRTDAPMCTTIPLLGVAWANLAHWRQSTNLTFYRELAAFPQPTVTGELAKKAGANGQLQPQSLKLGPAVGVQLTENSKFGWTELEGTSMTQLENGIKEKLQQMGQLGMSFLVSDTRAAETADAKRLDATAENSTLATAAQGIEDAVNSALSIHAWYLGIEDGGAPTIAVNKDFSDTVLDPQAVTALVDMCERLGYPLEEFLRALQAGGWLRQDADIEDLARQMQIASGRTVPSEIDPAALGGSAPSPSRDASPPSSSPRIPMRIERDANGRAIRLIPDAAA